MSRLKAPQRREQLIEVASKLFARGGYEATTTAAIAYAAGVTEPILYRHFKNKQELFIAIVRSVSDVTLKAWQAIVAHEQDPIRRIKLICEAIPDHIKRNGDAYHVLHGALSTSRDKKVLAVMKEHYQQIERFFAQLVADGQRAGAFRKNLDPKSAAWQLILSGIGYAMISLNLGPIERDTTREIIDSILDGWRA
jgi:AcrR family transcriptional regulator